ncbi:hypothetical protein H310_04703 [Aphanomyces invadans]|uniref:HID1 domain-containing protein n=1 Tax=Aphanomyces invadans TaxID=157072 RepID=A0A024UDG7_9STRA|nr:hypothetical protein H310_04703 [Aphanomyces invadans]ETW04426.1 hypothetical protein H310_04703 [Aphanomyces invadans]|eukprot:XP_008867382.1 hypothetical protein H310_04703 [Aphanomyces invadans]
MGNSDSKSKFRESVYKLSNEEVASRHLEFWDKLWKIPTTAEEIFTLIQPDDIRMLRQNQQGNLSTMLTQAISQLHQIVETPLPKYYPQAVNCIRVLTRVMPFILEDRSDEFVQQLLWGPPPTVYAAEASSEVDVPTSQLSLAQKLVDAMLGLLFLPDFTVSAGAYKAFREQLSTAPSSSANVVYPPLLWYNGVGYPDASAVASVQFDKNRKEVLKLLLTCFSSILYHTADSCDAYVDPFLAYATRKESRHAPTLFYSLVNVTLLYDPVGWGVPYAGSIVADERETLVDVSIQVLLVLLDFGAPARNVAPEGDSFAAFDSNNQYRALLSSIQREEDFELLFNGLAKLLNNYHQAMNTLLPNSIKQIKCHQELLVLLWKLLDENKAFLQFTLKRADMNRIVVPLLFLMYEGRKEPSKVGMIHICTFILLLLSGERDFAVNLNKPFDLKLPLDLPPFNGNHADLLIVCLHKVIVNGYEKLNSVYNCFLTIVSNISPYIKKLNMVSSVRLLRLFKLFSQPRYLFDNDANHHLVFFLLDTFNNLIQYQYEGNEQLVYAMVQNKDLFLKLSVLSMPISSTAVSVTPKAIPSKDSVDDVDVVPSVAALTALTDAPIDQDEAPPAPVQAKFTPTEEWLQGWKKKLPINTSLRLLQYLVPQLEQACEQASSGSLDEAAMLGFLRGTTMVGLLPVPHAIVIRKYQTNQFTNLWFTTFTWGVIFLRNQVFPLFDGASITLFTINVL